MIDWHSHILPQMDDGSRSVAESLELLRALSAQKIDCVIATPHFYANDESVDDFLKRRDSSYQHLNAHLTEDAPRIVLGSEVSYYPGISRLSGLEQLKIERTNLLLLEMPTSEWTESTVNELLELADRRDLTLVLAHIERYLPYQSKSVWNLLCEHNVLMQTNAGFFLNLGSRHKAFRLLRRGKIQLIGSDCHNMKTRPPRIGKAFEAIHNKFGGDFVCQMDQFGYSLFTKSE